MMPIKGIKKMITFHFLLVMFLALLNPFHQEASAKEIKVGFIYFTSIDDAGWSYAHEIGRQAINKIPGVTTDFVDSVSDDVYAESVLIHMARQKYDLVFATSFDYGDEINKVGVHYPETFFMHCGGFFQSKNAGTYFGRIYEARYLTGILAGAMTKSNIIGYVAAHPIPEVVRGINAFAIGVLESNPEAKIHVRWTHSWHDVPKEKILANELVDFNADVLAMHQDSPAVQVEAQKRGVYSIGYNHDMSSFAPKAQLTAAVWRWGVIYKYITKKVLEDNWKSESIWWGLKQEAVDIAPFGPMVPGALRKKILRKKQDIISENISVFSGPIKGQSGDIQIPKGKRATDEELLSMDWLMENVVSPPTPKGSNKN